MPTCPEQGLHGARPQRRGVRRHVDAWHIRRPSFVGVTEAPHPARIGAGMKFSLIQKLRSSRCHRDYSGTGKLDTGVGRGTKQLAAVLVCVATHSVHRSTVRGVSAPLAAQKRNVLMSGIPGARGQRLA